MQPKWSRRKEARPLEIVDAAVDVFLENGFAAAKLSDIAKRARVAKGTIYLYFETKEELFRAAARQLISTNLEGLETAQATFDGSIEELIPTLLQRAVSQVAMPACLQHCEWCYRRAECFLSLRGSGMTKLHLA